MDDPIKFVTCPECGNQQADMGKNVACEECGFGPMPTAEPKFVDVKLVFEDWKKGGISVYQTEEGAPLSYGDFHGGTTFCAQIKLDEEEEIELKEAIKKGYSPVFRLCL